MKTKEEIERALYNVNVQENKFSGLTYEEGVEEALSWVLEDLDDEDFPYASN